MDLSSLPTPALLLDRARFLRNVARMSARAAELGVALRPHLKTAKSARVAEAIHGGAGPITVSTLAEARYFLARGFRDITYAVGFVPAKLATAAKLIEDGASLTLVTDNGEAARAIAPLVAKLAPRLKVLIEIDCGDGRAGVAANSSALLEIAEALNAGGATVAGVLTHAGHSYGAPDIATIAAIAEDERQSAVHAASRLRQAGHPATVVSVGSTPTALFARSMAGVSEMRPGNFVFFDLFQAGLGTCTLDDIAVSVLAAVNGQHRARNHVLIDAGALALSKDVSANARRPGTGYGALWPLGAPAPLDDLAVVAVHQEHGTIGHPRALDSITPIDFTRFPVGTLLRVLPNHSCMTAAAYDHYHVVEDGCVVDRWDRLNGW
jgi:D-serine deaminase-like pyridoxal phosphate-dependent protein